MKRVIAVFLCLVLASAFAFPASAAENGEVVHSEEFVLENGLRVIDTITVYSNARASTVTSNRYRNIYDGDTLVAYIRFEATFRYDGSTVSVVSKTVTNTDTYDGWEYVQNSFTSSGGTVTLNAKLTKWFILNTSFTMTLSCDKDGNISYT